MPVTNELKTKIYEAVKAAASSGHLSDLEIAKAVGSTRESKTGQVLTSIAFTMPFR